MSDRQRRALSRSSTPRPCSLACTECRKQHVKCDAKKPCSRCMDAGLPCQYLPSRRGGRRRPRSSLQLASAGMNHEPSATGPQPITPFTGKETSPTGPGESIASPRSIQDSLDLDTRLVRLYYENFHPAHPILVPPVLFEQRNYPPFLHLVVRFIGSHYSVHNAGDSLRELTASELRTSRDRTPCMVQALLLFSIFLYARSECEEAVQMLSQAADLAVELGIFRSDFATTFANGNEIEAESLRRTWWELFIVDVFMAARQSKVTLRWGDVPYDVPLPCEESIYASRKDIPSPPTFKAFKMRVFIDADDHTYSSFAYRIEAAHILARVLVLNSRPEAHRDHLQAVENALISWANHLPQHKVEVIDMYGTVDEMLFQAQITIQYATMLLHLPRSILRLDLPDPEDPVFMMTPFLQSRTCTRRFDDVKATGASKELSNILSMRPSVHGYSPLIVPALVLCGMVQLATSRIHPLECSDHHCNRVVLVLGYLKVLTCNWPLASRAHQFLQHVAAETFTTWIVSQHPQLSNGLGNPSKNDAGKVISSTDPNAWLNAAPEVANPDEHPPFYPGPFSAYIDPICSDLNVMNSMLEFEIT